MTPATLEFKFKKDLTGELETCWNDVWLPAAEEQQEQEPKGDPAHEKKHQLSKYEDTSNSLLNTDLWLTTRFLISSMWRKSSRKIK